MSKESKILGNSYDQVIFDELNDAEDRYGDLVAKCNAWPFPTSYKSKEECSAERRAAFHKNLNTPYGL